MSELDISKMKVADLKKELRNRSMSTMGNKVELQERLQAVLIDLDPLVLSADDDALLNDEELSEEDLSIELSPPPPTRRAVASPPKTVLPKLKRSISVRPNSKAEMEMLTAMNSKDNDAYDSDDDKPLSAKVVIMSPALSQTERLLMRSTKFGAPLTAEAKLLARAARFGGGGTVAAAAASSGTVVLAATGAAAAVGGGDEKTVVTAAADSPADSADYAAKLRKRQERFGVVSEEMQKSVAEERLKKREQRFAAPEATPAAGGNDATHCSAEELRRRRMSRFSIKRSSPS